MQGVRPPWRPPGWDARSCCLAIDLDKVATMPCSPSIGGMAKGQLVKEIDALGGEMAKISDQTAIQYRTLNTKKGPAVQSSRTQNDKQRYHMAMKAGDGAPSQSGPEAGPGGRAGDRGRAGSRGDRIRPVSAYVSPSRGAGHRDLFKRSGAYRPTEFQGRTGRGIRFLRACREVCRGTGLPWGA